MQGFRTFLRLLRRRWLLIVIGVLLLALGVTPFIEDPTERSPSIERVVVSQPTQQSLKARRQCLAMRQAASCNPLSYIRRDVTARRIERSGWWEGLLAIPLLTLGTVLLAIGIFGNRIERFSIWGLEFVLTEEEEDSVREQAREKVMGDSIPEGEAAPDVALASRIALAEEIALRNARRLKSTSGQPLDDSQIASITTSAAGAAKEADEQFPGTYSLADLPGSAERYLGPKAPAVALKPLDTSVTSHLGDEIRIQQGRLRALAEWRQQRGSGTASEDASWLVAFSAELEVASHFEVALVGTGFYEGVYIGRSHPDSEASILRYLKGRRRRPVGVSAKDILDFSRDVTAMWEKERIPLNRRRSAKPLAEGDGLSQG